jgi:hypothetical protein
MVSDATNLPNESNVHSPDRQLHSFLGQCRLSDDKSSLFFVTVAIELVERRTEIGITL